EEFAHSGGVVIATGRKPSLAAGYQATDADTLEVAGISRRLFDDAGAPGVFVEDEAGLAKALANRLRPDVTMSPAAPQVGVVHRHTEDAEIYFLANTSNQPVTTRVTFRIEGLSAQVWNPRTGKTTPLAIADRPPGGTSVDVSLDAY